MILRKRKCWKKSYIWKDSIDLLDFLREDNHQRKVVSETSTLVACGQFCLSSNQIAEFFDHQYLWKKSINILDFSHGVRVLPHVKFCPGVNCFNFNPKNWCHTWLSTWSEMNIFFTSFHSGVKLYLQRFVSDFTKMFYGKSTFRMQLQHYIKAIQC